MTRVDQRPAAFGLAGADGNQLQRRMLQSLERQWLDSWGAANVPQPPASGNASADARALQRGAVPAPAQAAPESGAKTTPEDRPSEDEALARGRSPARADEAGQCTAAVEHLPRGQGVGSGAPTQSIDFVAEGGHFRRAGPTLQADFEPGAPRVDPSSVSTALPDATTALTAAANPAAPPTDGACEATANPRPPTRSSAAAEGRLGPQRFMLRELEPDVVQATLRDAQLDMAASQLAAQGLARALMEAGYAQVKVVVNGQQHRSDRIGPDDTAAHSGTPASTFTDVFTDAAPKDPAHGN